MQRPRAVTGKAAVSSSLPYALNHVLPQYRSPLSLDRGSAVTRRPPAITGRFWHASLDPFLQVVEQLLRTFLIRVRRPNSIPQDGPGHMVIPLSLLLGPKMCFEMITGVVGALNLFPAVWQWTWIVFLIAVRAQMALEMFATIKRYTA